MTDDEIRFLMYEYADCFTSSIHFTDQGVLDFANAVINASSIETQNTIKPETKERPQYEDALWTFLENADEALGL
jgi:hypothetical protein